MQASKSSAFHPHHSLVLLLIASGYFVTSSRGIAAYMLSLNLAGGDDNLSLFSSTLDNLNGKKWYVR